MKKIIWMAAIVMAGALSLPAQQGRGGPPLAWNDADKDGICDVTNKPVGQNPGQGRRMSASGGQALPSGQPMFAGRGLRGRGMGTTAWSAGWRGRPGGFADRNWGRGMAWRRPVNPGPDTQSAPTESAAPDNTQ